MAEELTQQIAQFRFNLSAEEIKQQTGWSDQMVIDYLNIFEQVQILAQNGDSNNAQFGTVVQQVNLNTQDIQDNRILIQSNEQGIISLQIGVNTLDQRISANDTLIAALESQVGQLQQVQDTYFQAQKSGTATSGAALAALTGWSEQKNSGLFTLDSGNGTIAIPSDGEYSISVQVYGANTVASPTMMDIQAEIDPAGGGSWSLIPGTKDADYSPDLTFLNLGCQVSSTFFSAIAGDLVRVVWKHTGNPIDCDSARITIRKES